MAFKDQGVGLSFKRVKMTTQQWDLIRLGRIRESHRGASVAPSTRECRHYLHDVSLPKIRVRGVLQFCWLPPTKAWLTKSEVGKGTDSPMGASRHDQLLALRDDFDALGLQPVGALPRFDEQL